MTDSNLVANAVVASASSQWISIVPENGEQFNPNQKIIYNIEPEIAYIKKDSYLVFDILNTSSDLGRYTLQKNLGAHSIIDRVDIFSKETGILLESNTHYREMVNLSHQYLKDTTNTLSSQEGVGVPVQSWTHQVSAVGGVSTTHSVPLARDIENNQLSPMDNVNTAGGGAKFMTRRFCIPLKVGLFGAYQAEEKAIPVMNFGGLRIEITLAKPKDALQRLAGNYNDTTYDAKHNQVPLDWTKGVASLTALADSTGGATMDWILELNGVATAAIQNDQLQNLGLVVGNKVKVSGVNNADAAFTTKGVISNITATNARNIIINGKQHARMRTLTISINGLNNGTGSVNSATTGVDRPKIGCLLQVDNSDANYKVMNCEYRLLQVIPPTNVLDGNQKGIDYEFTGYEVFFDNIPSGTLRHQIPIHSVASKALAIFTNLHYTYNADGDFAGAQDKLEGNLPKDTLVNDIVYFINNRLYPLRSYNPQVYNDRVLCINEFVKAWRALGLQPLNLGSVDYGDMEDFTNVPLIARELARGGMVFDLRSAEPELRLSFSGVRTAANQGILRANTYVFSKKIIQTTATGLQVIH